MIPIYRAKKIDSDEFVEGFLLSSNGNEIIRDSFMNIHIVSSSTIAINFPDMLDSQGNKIFASLSEDGKGGDRLQGFNDSIYKFRVYYTNFTIMMTRVDVYLPTALDTRLKVIGIQK